MSRLERTASIREVINILKDEGVLNNDGYIYTYEGLCDYLGKGGKKPCTKTIERWKKAGIIKAYKMGRKVFFKKHEIDQAMIQLSD